MPHVELTDRAEAAAKRDAAKAPIAIASLDVTGTQNQAADLAVDLREELGIGEGAADDGTQTYLVGQQALWAGMQDLSKEDLEAAEATGFPIVLIILLAVFGSLAAAALPLALGFASVMVTGAIIYFLSQSMDMSVFTTNVASMVGIGVAVDYSLFILARYREEIRAGATPEEARRTSMRTSGVAVVFSGLTVMISLARAVPRRLHHDQVDGARGDHRGGGLDPRGRDLPAGRDARDGPSRLHARAPGDGGRPDRAQPALAQAPPRVDRSRGAARRLLAALDRSRHATARGVRTRSAGVLLVLAIPALSLAFGDGALRQFPEGNETRVGAELAAKELGPGASGPTQIVATFDEGTASDPGNRGALARWRDDVAGDPEVAQVGRPQPSDDGRAALLTVAPKSDSESMEARAMMDRLRAEPGSIARVADVQVGGATAAVEDFKDLVAGSMWKIALFVLAFSYLVLFVLLRSVLLPLKAVVMNMLTVAAAYGVLVAIFQYGWLDGFLGFESLGYINTITPPFLLAIVFGLSMDYEVFLLSRIRERYDATGDTKTAVAQGLAKSAATISSAALIMVAVFAVFAGTGVPSIKEIGVGLSVAIFLDATLVRLVLVPATMEIMGEWNWWLPKPIARVLPEANFEASGRWLR